METFDLTQTGAQVQDILDKAAQLPSKATLDTELNAKADKSNTYTKAEVLQLLSAAENGTYERVDTVEELGDPTAEKEGIIWLVGAEDAEEFDRYIVGKDGDDYTWVYLGTTAVDLTAKADKVADAVDGDLAGLDENGNLTDSGYKPSDFATAAQGEKADSAYQLPGSGIPMDDLATEVQNTLNRVDNKADKVGSGHADEIATFNSAGNLKASGTKVSDIRNEIAAVESAKADKASSNPAMLVGSALGIMGNTPQAALFTHRAVPAGAGSGAAQMRLLRGRSIVWNQLIKAKSIPFSTSEDITSCTANDDGSYTIVVANTLASRVESSISASNGYKIKPGHNYFVNNNSSDVDHLRLRVPNFGVVDDQSKIWPVPFNYDDSTSNAYFRLSFEAGTPAGTYTIKPQVIDITALTMPDLTAPAFEALYPGFHGYNSGTIKNMMAAGLLSDGFNQFNEQPIDGLINSDGVTIDTASSMKHSDYIPAFPNTEYYLNKGAASQFAVFSYDADKNYLGRHLGNVPDGGSFTTPANTAYIRINIMPVNIGSVCLNISNPARNGQYEPYRSYTTSLPITTMTGKAGGVGDSVVIYPDGMMAAGSVYDELVIDADGWARKAIRRMNMVNLGSLTWIKQTGIVFSAPIADCKTGGVGIIPGYTFNSNFDQANLQFNFVYRYSNRTLNLSNSSYADADALTAGLNGVYCVYELAIPVEYTLDTPIYMGYPVDADGTETMLPDQTGLSEPTSAPMDYDVVYPVDLAGNLVTELNAMLTANSLAGSFAKNGNGGVTYSAE